MADSYPLGYMSRLKAVSRQTAVSTYTDTNISTIIGSAIESYMRSFFETTGKYRNLLPQFAPSLMKYIADPTYNNDDPTKTFLTIERYNERLAAHPPCMIINDSGVVLRSAGFGRSAWQARTSSTTIGHTISVLRDVPISILVAASSKADLVTLLSAIHTIFYDIASFINGRLLTPDNATDTWLLRLPLQMDAGSYEKNNQGDDPQMQIWTSTFSFTATFEDCFMLTSEDMSYTVSNGTIGEASIEFPSSIRVGRKVIGSVTNMQTNMKLLSSDYNIATLSQGNNPAEYLLLAKRPGTFQLQLAQGATSDKYEGQGSSIQPNVIVAKTITISF